MKLHRQPRVSGFGCNGTWTSRFWWMCVSWFLCSVVVWSSVLSVVGGAGQAYNFTLALLIATTNNGPGKISGGAFFVALDDLNNNLSASLTASTGDTAHFRYVFRDTRNDDVTAMRAMVDLHCDEETNVTAFIGPDVLCSNAALVASSFNISYISYDCNDIHTLKDNMHRYLVVNMEPSLAHVAKSIVALLKYYQWRSFWLVTGNGDTNTDWTDAGENLQDLASKEGITVNDVSKELLNDKYHSGLAQQRQPYPKIIQESRYKTRVYVFLGDYNSLIDFLRALNDEGVTSRGDHVVIAAVDYNTRTVSGGDSFFRVDEQGGTPEQSQMDAFRNVLLLMRQQPKNHTVQFNERVYAKNSQHPINGPKLLPSWKKPPFRQEAYYLYDAVMQYGTAVLDLIRDGLDPYDSRLVIGKIRNTTIRSIQGFDVHINDVGESEGSYVVRSIASNASGLVPDLWQVGSFQIEEGGPKLAYRPNNISTVAWVTGSVPVSDPVCGFDGSKCKSDEEMEEWRNRAIGIGLAVFFVLAVGILFIGLRYWFRAKRMRAQTLSAHGVCSNSFAELRAVADEEGLLA